MEVVAWTNAAQSDRSTEDPCGIPNKTHDELPHPALQIPDEELAFYYQSSTEHGDDNIWGLLSGVGGNIYEW
jgi:hypothetical protein